MAFYLYSGVLKTLWVLEMAFLDALFNSMMKDIFGPVSKKGPPPSTLVTPKHLHQLEAFRKQVPQSDRSFVEVWIRNLKPHEKKEGSNIT
jgi:hypothetical protein